MSAEVKAPGVAVENLLRRVLQDAMTEAVPAYWLRRAEEFEAARPAPGDFRGFASDSEIVALDDRLASTAQACRDRAEFLRICPDVLAEQVAADVDSLMAGGASDGRQAA